MHTTPSAISASAKISPPSITMNRANAIAGSAASTRAFSSERGRSRAARRRRTAGPPRVRRADALRRRPLSWRAPGVCGPPAIRPPSAAAEPAPAVGELGQRLLQRGAREVRPQLVAEDELGVGRLPQQVIGQAPLAARADDQVGVVHL